MSSIPFFVISKNYPKIPFINISIPIKIKISPPRMVALLESFVPNRFPITIPAIQITNVKKYDRISVKEIVDKKLGIMDLAAAVLSMDNKMPMIIFGLNEEDSIVHTVNNQITGTIVEV